MGEPVLGSTVLSSFGLQGFTVECPLCCRLHTLTVDRDAIQKLCRQAGYEAVRARLDRLALDRALVRCPACIVQHGGEQPAHNSKGETP